MKKIFTLVTASVVSMAAMATNYTGTLTVNNATTQTGVTATIEDNTVTLNGVTVTDCAVNTVKGITTLVNKTAAAQVVAHYGYDSAYAVINMTLADGTTYYFENVDKSFQLPNSDFETWTASSGEPQYWHGFKSAYGGLASMAKSTFVKDTNTRPGSTGSYSGLISSSEVNLGIAKIVANGTMTNGQLKANSATATNTDNHSEMDRTSTRTDKDGNPFYMKLPARPDSIKVWVKFSQGTANKNYPYATFNAVAFDDTSIAGKTYYQDPEDKEYTNVVARASNNTIAVCNWTELSIPFVYNPTTDANKNADAILVTMSTNATPGKGSKGDQIFIDDLTLVYKAEVTSVTYKGQQLSFTDGTCDLGTVTEAPVASDFAVAYSGASASAGCTIVETEDSYIAYVYAVSGDLLTTDVYTVVMHKAEEAIMGDVNDDKTVDIADINAVVKIILNQEKDEKYISRSDLNGDKTIDIVDINAIINIILNKK